MVEIVAIGLWVAIWFSPRWSILNKAGLIVFLSMAPSAALVWFVAPELFVTMLYWWTAYMAAFLVLGSAIIVWRIKEDRELAANSSLAAGTWSPIIAKGILSVIRVFAQLAAAGAVLMTVYLLIVGAPQPWWGLIITPLIVLGPLLPLLLLWLITKVADILMGSTSA